ncbi:Protein GrpE [Candidatus Portiera aleyrodidarum]|uniref:Protein GrpE n=1 Tax=Candidatus Portiera aleyrodidarum TV TaxID=1297582 RepID=A0A8D3X797_9GAMM|nr:nucleotide exchange factor GrpE [Candidatus Portiera aleyrodidarum]AGI27271.1 molecular chaperone GrpE (heat shock protein) [Candidatus Portiera aleyrodidarum TV]CEI59268.1 Protein GrpE [Candidatus Portiera aleyrodidarum]
MFNTIFYKENIYSYKRIEKKNNKLIQKITDKLKSRIFYLEIELENSKNQTLKYIADTKNYIRRADKELEKTRKFAIEKFIKELIPVIDGLEKAFELMKKEKINNSHIEGLKLTLNMQLNVIKKFGVNQINPIGKIFNPLCHEALATVKSLTNNNTIIDVLQKGYILNDRLLRPAMVIVSKNN